MKATRYFTTTPSPVGELFLYGTAAGLEGIVFERARDAKDPNPAADWAEDPRALATAVRELQEYFEGRRKDFDLEVGTLAGTPFQQGVWRELRAIPYGETISYGELARRVGRPKASRAVGAANGRNPLPIIVPCHRVIASTGRLHGYSGGLDTKACLLELEGVRCS